MSRLVKIEHSTNNKHTLRTDHYQAIIEYRNNKFYTLWFSQNNMGSYPNESEALISAVARIMEASK